MKKLKIFCKKKIFNKLRHKIVPSGPQASRETITTVKPFEVIKAPFTLKYIAKKSLKAKKY